MRSELAAVVMLLSTASACATTGPSPVIGPSVESSLPVGAPGTRREGAYPVRVEWDVPDADGVVFVGEEKVCRVPCTIWLRASEDASVRQDAPRAAIVALPRIPGLDTYDEPPRIGVRPARGHPGAALGLSIPGGLMSAVFVPLAVVACSNTNRGVDSGNAQLLCFEASLAASVGVLVLVSGILMGVESAWPSADLETSHARNKRAVDLRVVPGGVGGSF